MQNVPWKKIAIAVVAVGIIGFGIFYFTKGADKKETSSYMDPAFGEYITSYTAGVVSSNSAFRIILTKDAVDSASVGQETSVKLFDFSPSVKGKTVWLNKNTVEFRPESRLPSGQVYEVGFMLGKLITVSKALSEFKYSFQVMPQNYEVSIENVKPYIKTELKRQRVEGILNTADFAEDGAVEGMVKAKQEGKELKVTWTHTAEGKQHNFVVEDVARKDEPSKVNLSVDGTSLGVKTSSEEEIEIPALGDFKVVNAKVVQNPNQYVVLQFSDPLKEKQELRGLITIEEDRSLTLDFEIHDNEIWVYPPVRQAGVKTLRIEMGVRNINDYKMKAFSVAEVTFEQLKPLVRFVGKGNILPSTDGLILPFEAVNLKAVDLTITKIFENNILQFLQVNNIKGNYDLNRVGRVVLKKKVQLDNTGITDLGKWNRYTLDLSTLINTEPGAIYQITLGFKRPYSAFICEDDDAENQVEVEEEEGFTNQGYEGGEYYDEEYEYYEDDYDWDQRDNPCNSSYYSSSSRTIKKNVLASDFGITAKRGYDDNTMVIVTDLKTTQPLANISLEFYDFQQQLLGTVATGSDGKAIFNSKETPFAVIAKNGAQRGYMRLTDGESLSLSGFDVSGEYIDKGLKGFIYGERGVWRPGDSLFLSFMLEDRNKTLPSSHPVVFELQNPQGIVTNRQVKSVSENGFYLFATSTSPDAPTGNWMARIKVGGTYFNQQVKIETVKPNRLKILLDFGTERITGNTIKGNLDVKWLHGAPGKNLNANFDLTILKANTAFPKYNDYTFEEPSGYYTPETQTAFDGSTDAEGKASFNATLESSANFPGFMTAVFRGKVFEESGNFSIDRFSLPYFPYESYVGLKTPKGEAYSGMLYTDTTHRIDVAFLDVDGNPVARDGAEITLYRLNRYWWWDNSQDNIANYVQGNNAQEMASGTLNAPNGKASWKFSVPSPDWGTYYIRVCDPVSGHCTGKTVYIDQPGYYSRYSRNEDKGGATKLTFSSDKTKYNVGEKIKLTIPSSGQGRALVSVENGSRVLNTFWVETQKGDTQFSIDATAEMTPNIFVNVSLLQPHSQTINDLPIRMYGVIPIGIEDPATHIEPIISMPDELEPGKEVTIKVSEKSKRKMTFTLAVVDEGLLDITKFKTPEPWKNFYAREALGVKTWDVFDDVMGAFGSRIERLLAIGGDDEMKAKEEDPRANRFKAVVKFFGPITLDGGTKEIKFIMPQYIGSVKTMVVAGYEGAYGQAEKATPVRKPLMVLATLPRVLGPEETLKLPITLFTQDKKIKNVKIEIKAQGPLTLPNGSTRNVVMSPSGDLTVDFDLAVKSETGIGKITVIASSGSIQSTDEIEIEVRNPNPLVSQVSDTFLEKGKTWNGSVVPVGVAGTNDAVLEVSTIPPINLGYRLQYLMEYPHGCIEQTTSAAFPQLYLDVVKKLTESEKSRTRRNVQMAIERVKLFITRDGGFAYWPGYQDADSWGTSYAGHFLIEAESKGYYVPADMLKRWKKFQKNKAMEWRKNENAYYNTDQIQAYRLYTLAASGAAELSAMNRLREMPDISISAKWTLAAAYVRAGQPEAGKKIVSTLTTNIKPYQELGYSYGSDLRDKAIILETLTLLDERAKGFEVLKEISSQLSSSSYWMSTQTVAFCLKSVGLFVAQEKLGNLSFAYTYGGKTVHASTDLPLSQIQLPVTGIQKSAINFTNESGGSLFVRVINTGIPARGAEESEENNLVLTTSYYDVKGKVIDPTKLEQGTEFIVSVSVKNPGLRGQYKNMALSQIFPSGWEINNLRLNDDEATAKTDRGDYQDIRDDRVYTYFDLAPGKVRTFNTILTASYAGSYYLPAVSCEAMYDHSIYARKKGQVVEVVKVVVVIP